MKKKIYLGNTSLQANEGLITGDFVSVQDEKFYRIMNFNLMPDFFMTLVSDSDHWMFISSNGSLSAGRKNRNNALFPYYSDDKIHDYAGMTGSKSVILVQKDEKTFLWEPFSRQLSHIYQIERNLYKSIYGNKIIFEEVNKDLGITFRYGWSFSEKFGFVKNSGLVNNNPEPLKIEILDGICNILPNGVDYGFQNEYSNLLDAYKKAELEKETGLGLFTLSSIPVDRAEPSESLFATTVWSEGLPDTKILISDHQLEDFRKGHAIETETDIRASRGAYFVYSALKLDKNQSCDWILVAEINQDSTAVANLNKLIAETSSVRELLKKDIEKGTDTLKRIVAAADGLQNSNEELCSARHYSNTLFNVMRGGIYINNYTVEKNDFTEYVKLTNKKFYEENSSLLSTLPKEILNSDLIHFAETKGNADFIRICYEYLPLTFSRRHGDPSRPWNQFSIENKNQDGSPKLDFQGNWRDIFQNWEALSVSYPGFIENIISKFVNASTADGYNPYRIMRDGIDWEAPDPHDPWAYIGYWGDHQIIYLQKLLELSNNYHPGNLEKLLAEKIFVYANVPYRIKSYDEIKRNPQDTITFDYSLDKKIRQNVRELGADARLLMDKKGSLYNVNLTEKILVTLLAKLSNFVPEAGIWLNTQRPEWNDANNALVGNGVSMVTLYYLRRFLKFWNEKFSDISLEKFEVSEEVKVLFDDISQLFTRNTGVLTNGFSNKERLHFTDALGQAGSVYRNTLYENSFSGNKKTISTDELKGFTHLALQYIDQSILVNKRSDGLYHAYNLISFNENGVSIRHLYEMLEGQVAVLSSGLLTPQESLDVLNALKKSALFRKDQYSYVLYPDRQLPRFVEKNIIPQDKVNGSKLLSKLLAENNTKILSADKNGNFHFDGTFRNAQMLDEALEKLDQKLYGTLVRKEKNKIHEIFEEMFDHQSFTGRSGTFYGYEGLGSIYWHMVSKLLLAVEECFFKAVDNGDSAEIIGGLKEHYFEIKAGIGLYKSPQLYGAFPTDPYSHTPGNAGAKQPGMTGQVKEDFISRMGELGVRVNNGEIVFDTHLLNQQELTSKKTVFKYYDVKGKKQQLDLTEKQLGFTFCQVPVIYTLSNDHKKIFVGFKDGRIEKFTGDSINKKISNMIFNRDGEVELIQVYINQ